MSISAIDTLKLARLLRNAGIAQAQSEQLADYLREAMTVSDLNLARRDEVEALRATLSDGQEDTRRDINHALEAITANLRGFTAEHAMRQARIAGQLRNLLVLLIVLIALLCGVLGTLAYGQLTAGEAMTHDNRPDSAFNAAGNA